MIDVIDRVLTKIRRRFPSQYDRDMEWFEAELARRKEIEAAIMARYDSPEFQANWHEALDRRETVNGVTYDEALEYMFDPACIFRAESSYALLGAMSSYCMRSADRLLSSWWRLW